VCPRKRAPSNTLEAWQFRVTSSCSHTSHSIDMQNQRTTISTAAALSKEVMHDEKVPVPRPLQTLFVVPMANLVQREACIGPSVLLGPNLGPQLSPLLRGKTFLLCPAERSRAIQSADRDPKSHRHASNSKAYTISSVMGSGRWAVPLPGLPVTGVLTVASAGIARLALAEVTQASRICFRLSDGRIGSFVSFW
jgi:hypothetical protein